MKRAIYTLLLLLLTGFLPLSSSAKKQAVLRPYALLPARTQAKSWLRPVQLDLAAVQDWRKQAYPELQVALPLPTGEEVTVSLVASGAISGQQEIRQTGGNRVIADQGIHYYTPKESKVQAALSLFDLKNGTFQFSGIIIKDAKTFVIGPQANGDLVLFAESEASAPPAFACHSEELAALSAAAKGKIQKPDNAPQACAKTVKFFIEADYQAYADNNLNVNQTVAWINSVWNVVGKLYYNINVNIEVTQIYLNTKPDNYPSKTSIDALNAFGDTLKIRSVTADLSHLLSTKATNLGGIAYLDVLCNTGNNYGFSNCNVSYAELPAYSWTINVISHEVGHNFGSNHTQWCGWDLGGGKTGMIDSCYAAEDAGLGVCYSGPVLPRFGTIMSYCHLTAPQGGVDLALGFGPLPSNVIANSFKNAICLTAGTSIPNVTIASLDTACEGEPYTLSVSAVTNGIYSWTGPNGFKSNLREPTLPSFAANQAGTYQVVVSVGLCISNPYSLSLVANCIGATPIGSIVYCNQDPFSVTFNANFNPTGANKYQVELSNFIGIYNSYPTIIGTVTTTSKSGKIAVTLPDNMLYGFNYKIRVRSTSPAKIGAGADQLLTILARAASPTTTGASRTSPGPLTLLAVPAAGASSVWYSDSTTTTVLAKGNNYTTPTLSATRKYYVESDPSDNQAVGQVDKGAYTGNYIFNNARGLYFRVLSPMVLDSVTLYPGSGGTIMFTIKDTKTGAKVFSGTAAVANSAEPQKVKVGAQLKAGSYVITPEGSTGINSMYRILDYSTTLDYPFVIKNLVSIDSATVSNYALNAWYFFYNWKVKPLVCKSIRVPVLATISNACSPPAAPTATGTTACKGSQVTLTASGLITGYQYQWYNVPTGGTVLPNGQTASYSFTADFSDTLWVGLQSTTAPTCTSSRTRVIITVITNPASPKIISDSSCPSKAVTLTASGAINAQFYEWFAYPSGGTALQSSAAAKYTYVPAANKDTLYVQIKESSAPSCSSARAPVVVKTRRVPASITVADSARCGPGSVTLVGSSTNKADTVQWLNAQNQVVGKGNSFQTPGLSATTTYQVKVISNGGCASTSSATRAVINPIPPTPTLSLKTGNLVSSNTGTHIWLFNGAVSAANTAYQVVKPALGSWRAITVLGPCKSDTSAPFLVVGIAKTLASTPTIFPNPTSDWLHIENASEYTRFEIANMLGQTQLAGGITSPIPVSNLPKGIYFLKLSGPAKQTYLLRFTHQ